jgi:S1-C subfamily serine protease
MRLIDSWSDIGVPGPTRRLLLAVLATLAPAVAASPAGAAGHATLLAQRGNPNAGIVDIYTTLGYQSGAAAGTGMIVSSSGEVLTNNHVIRGATSFKVVDVTTHRTYPATVVGYSVTRDVAVLQLARATGLRPIRVNRSAPVRIGQAVVARGNAQGRGGAPKAARGRIVAVHRQIVAKDDSGDSETLSNLMATDAPVEPGDSGGPLENARNQAIGMVTAGSTTSLVHRGFAIPIRAALGVASLIMAGKSSATVHVGPTAFLGVVLQNVSGGAQLSQVLPGKAADNAGLVAGDVITSLDGTAIASSADLRKAVLTLVPGKSVPIAWTGPSGTPQTGTITPTAGPPQ